MVKNLAKNRVKMKDKYRLWFNIVGKFVRGNAIPLTPKKKRYEAN
jgi:hypothetical protein